MSNPSKAKGTAAETAVVRYLRDSGFPLAERLALHGGKDIGDIRACPGVILEVKHWATYTDTDIIRWFGETTREQANANASVSLLVVRRAGKGNPGDWWAWRKLPGFGWHSTWLVDAVYQLRVEGWGTPHA